MTAADLAKAKTVKTVGGHALDLKFGDDKAWVGIQDSKATKTDVAAGNGIVHFMDGVILPKDSAAGGSAPAPVYAAADLAGIKTLAAATLKTLDAPGTPGTAAKLTELKAAWDAQQGVLKPKDPGDLDLARQDPRQGRLRPPRRQRGDPERQGGSPGSGQVPRSGHQALIRAVGVRDPLGRARPTPHGAAGTTADPAQSRTRGASARR